MFCGLNNCESFNRNLQNRKLVEENDLLQSSTLLILCVKVSPPRMCLQVSDVKAHTHKPIQSDLPMTPLQNLPRITTRMNFTSIKVTPTSPTPYTSTRLHLHSYTRHSKYSFSLIDYSAYPDCCYSESSPCSSGNKEHHVHCWLEREPARKVCLIKRPVRLHSELLSC